jgi:DNA repair exonuclease SbcCD ATPase subunit
MIIKDVKIKNFFCYVEENKFKFEEGLNIISARNGGGKSQLFNAFYWVFFNSVYTNYGENNTKKKWKNADDIILCPDFNKYSVGINEEIETSVEISLLAPNFRDDNAIEDTIPYKFRKTIVYEKTEDFLKISYSTGLQVEYVLNNETHFAESFEIESLLNKIFPTSLRKFMWYQGETMDDLYDFSNDRTLREAINGISYYPIYDTLDKVVKLSEKNVNNLIWKKQRKENKLSKEQNEIIDIIQKTERDVESKNKQKIAYESEIQDIEDKIINVETKLQGFDHFIKFKLEMVELEGKLEQTKDKLDHLEHSTKDDLIKKWMLNDCEELISNSQKNLDILNKEIQEINKSKNPVPITLPGPEYVEQMLSDNICYICERPVEENTDAYEALKRRMSDFEINLQNRILSDNFTELNRYKRRLISDLPKINEEIQDVEKTKQSLIQKRNSFQKKINNLYSEIGTENKNQVDDGAHTANNLTNQLKTYRQEVKSKTRYLQDTINSLNNLEEHLKSLKTKSDSFIKSTDDLSTAENKAKVYIDLFVETMGVLKDKAYDKLINELEQESNRLYSLYLNGKEQGRIKFTKNGIRVLDNVTGKFLDSLNTGEEVAEKLAVANSFLSLSAIKMNKSYPLIADAPTSDLDADNTYNLTCNISKSFDQMIIMSKDYSQFEGDELADLIRNANISRFYDVTNVLIDPEGENTRTNKKSLINRIK